MKEALHRMTYNFIVLCFTRSLWSVCCSGWSANELYLKQCADLSIEIDLLEATLIFSACMLIDLFMVLQRGFHSGQFCAPKLCVLKSCILYHYNHDSLIGSNLSRSKSSNELLLNFLTNSLVITLFSGLKWASMSTSEGSHLFEVTEIITSRTSMFLLQTVKWQIMMITNNIL